MERIEDDNKNKEFTIKGISHEIAEGNNSLSPELVENSIQSIKEIVSTVCSSVTSWKQIDLEMLRLDVMFNSVIAKLDFDLEKYKASIPIVEKQLDYVNVQIGKILDHVLTMEAKTESEICMKMRLLESSEKYLDRLSSMMMKLI